MRSTLSSAVKRGAAEHSVRTWPRPLSSTRCGAAATRARTGGKSTVAAGAACTAGASRWASPHPSCLTAPSFRLQCLDGDIQGGAQYARNGPVPRPYTIRLRWLHSQRGGGAVRGRGRASLHRRRAQPQLRSRIRLWVRLRAHLDQGAETSPPLPLAPCNLPCLPLSCASLACRCHLWN